MKLNTHMSYHRRKSNSDYCHYMQSKHRLIRLQAEQKDITLRTEPVSQLRQLPTR